MVNRCAACPCDLAMGLVCGFAVVGVALHTMFLRCCCAHEACAHFREVPAARLMLPILWSPVVTRAVRVARRGRGCQSRASLGFQCRFHRLSSTLASGEAEYLAERGLRPESVRSAYCAGRSSNLPSKVCGVDSGLGPAALRRAGQSMPLKGLTLFSSPSLVTRGPARTARPTCGDHRRLDVPRNCSSRCALVSSWRLEAPCVLASRCALHADQRQ